MTPTPFSVNGVEPSRWREASWLKNAPSIDLPPATTHLVVLAAHADDETLGVGGLLHAAASRIDRVTVFVVSDGAASHPNSPTITPSRLAELRADELAAAMAILDPDAEVHALGLPDGALADHLPDLVAELEKVLDDDVNTWLLSTWIDDGHPDHAACARAAQEVAGRRLRTRLFEFPIWYWHIGDPGRPSDSFVRSVLKFPLAEEDQLARTQALTAYPSQIAPLSAMPGDEAVLPAAFLEHFDRDWDVLVDVTPRPAGDAAYFDDLYSSGADPWNLADSWYERRKRSVLLASLPREHFRRAFEPGSARGDLSIGLVERVDELWCAESSAAAIEVARRRLPGSVHIERLHIPEGWPSGRFDLIVLSEVGYYVEDLDQLVSCIDQSLDDDGVLAMVHWRHVAIDHPHTAETVHAALRMVSGLTLLTHHEESDFLLDVLSRDGLSVAQLEGLI